MLSTEQGIQILIYVLVAIVMLIFVLLIIGCVIWATNRKKQGETENSEKIKNEKISDATKNGADKQSIFNFMEFDTVDDNMIIQKDGTRFLMVIECQGINYDLMSGVEKAGVEEGFIQFLNTLRNPIQIYVQTRTVNLEKSISTYKEKLKKVEEKLNRMKMQYYEMKETRQYTQEQLDRAFFELTKQTNLYEYGRDVINDTERMSLNKSVLNRKFYIIVPYYASELASSELDKAETQNLAFSEIYTRAQSLISSLSPCGVKGKILKTNELIELLYMSYNRDEAEVFGLNKAIQAGYNEINSTAPDVLDKKIKELDKYIQEKAQEKARDAVNEVMNEKAQRVAVKEENLQDLIREMAEVILKENEKYLGKEITVESIAKIEGDKVAKEKKGGREDGKNVSKATRGRKSTKADN